MRRRSGWSCSSTLAVGAFIVLMAGIAVFVIMGSQGQLVFQQPVPTAVPTATVVPAPCDVSEIPAANFYGILTMRRGTQQDLQIPYVGNYTVACPVVGEATVSLVQDPTPTVVVTPVPAKKSCRLDTGEVVGDSKPFTDKNGIQYTCQDGDKVVSVTGLPQPTATMVVATTPDPRTWRCDLPTPDDKGDLGAHVDFGVKPAGSAYTCIQDPAGFGAWVLR